MPTWLAGLKRPLQIGLVAAVLAAAASLLMPNYYRSELRILPVDSKSSGLGGLAAAAAAFGVAAPGGDSADANFVDILQSRWMAERLLKTEFTFTARSSRLASEKPFHETLLAYLHTENQDQAAAQVRQILSVNKDLKSKVITLSAETTSPMLSQQILEKAAALLEEFVQQKGRTRGGAKAAFAEARLKESRLEMVEAETAFRRFLEGNRNYQTSGDPSVRIVGSRLEAELKLRQQLVTTLAMNREQALMEEKNDVPILNVLDPANLPINKSRPARSSYVFLAFFLATSATWAWLNREWIKERLAEDGSTNKKENA